VALGPEGGLEADERAAFESGGWRLVSIGSTTLRFETAGVAATSIVSAALAAHQP
jgi:16S rRNA (uracil1498-N3)-methyltransferase